MDPLHSYLHLFDLALVSPSLERSKPYIHPPSPTRTKAVNFVISCFYKNPDKPKCTDLILTNCPNYFQQNNVFETGLSDFHVMVVTELKMGFQKLKPHIVAYRDYKHFHNEKFRSDNEHGASEKKQTYSY